MAQDKDVLCILYRKFNQQVSEKPENTLKLQKYSENNTVKLVLLFAAIKIEWQHCLERRCCHVK